MGLFLRKTLVKRTSLWHPAVRASGERPLSPCELCAVPTGRTEKQGRKGSRLVGPRHCPRHCSAKDAVGSRHCPRHAPVTPGGITPLPTWDHAPVTPGGMVTPLPRRPPNAAHARQFTEARNATHGITDRSVRFGTSPLRMRALAGTYFSPRARRASRARRVFTCLLFLQSPPSYKHH